MSKKETVLVVEGMTCANCVRHVEGALGKIEGVTSVAVDLGAGRARVEHDPAKASLAAMIAAVDDAGYASKPLA